MITLCLTLVMLILCFTGCGGSKDHKDTQTQAQVQKPATEEQKPVADGINVIDVFAGVDLTKGIYTSTMDSVRDGSGHYWVEPLQMNLDNIDYDRSNADMKAFLQSIDFYWVESNEMGNKLKNGDTITIGLEYSKSDAEALGITLFEETKTIAVDWLKEVYRDASEVDMERVKAIYEDAEPVQCAVGSTADNWSDMENYSFTTSERTFFEYEEDGNGNRYISCLLVLVTVNHEYDYEGEHEQFTTNTLVRVELDKSDANFDYLQNEAGYEEDERLKNRYRSIEDFCPESDEYAVAYGWHAYTLSQNGELAYLEDGDDESSYVELEEFHMN